MTLWFASAPPEAFLRVTVKVAAVPPVTNEEVEVARVRAAPLIRTGICVVLPLAVAVMVAVRVAGLLDPEVKVTCALPLASLTADEALSTPVVVEKVTVIPGSAAFEPSTTVAMIVLVVELSDATVVSDELRLIDDTTDAVVVPTAVKPNRLLVTVAPLTVAVAVTLSAPVVVPALSATVATPLASVNAVAPTGEKIPKFAPVVLNDTTTPARPAPAPLLSVAERVAPVVAEIDVVDPVRVKVGLAATGVVVVVLFDEDPPPPQALIVANNARTSQDEMARVNDLFNGFSRYGCYLLSSKF